MASAGSITFSNVSATNLAQADGSSDTDPYVRWSLGSKTIAETAFLRNVMGRRGRTPGSERTPKWDSEYLADLPMPYDANGSVTISEIRSMAPEEQQRYAAAVRKMMEDGSTPESSEFFRLAGYHGWPGNGAARNYSYCEHRQETFPGWHRAYLCAFEEALQAADVALGGDGRIGLPYWDVIGQPEVDGQVIPQILREHFPNGVDVPRGVLEDPEVKGDAGAGKQRRRLWDKGFAIVSDATIKRAVVEQRLGEKAQSTLWIPQHYRAASTFGSSNQDSVETPHDLVHVLCGFPMASLMHAAFHPLFWLHHCNIDRLYEAYLAHHPDSRREFDANQQRSRFVNKRKNKGVDRYEQWLEPFHLPHSTRKFFPRHTFDTAKLGYVYDALQQRPPQAMTAQPVYAVFEHVDINALPSSYALHAFVYPKDLADAPSPPMGPDLDVMLDDKFYAGLGGVFAGRADVCTNCQNSDPFDVRIDVSAKLAQLGLTADSAVVKVVAMDEEEAFLSLEQTAVPPPVLRGGGPSFEPLNDDDGDGDADGDKATFPRGSVVTYAVEEAPGYLPRGGLLNEVTQCFAAWAGPACTGLEFRRLPAAKADEAQLVVAWEDHSGTNSKRFDGPGGKLAEATAQRIVFDSAERWLLHGVGWPHFAQPSSAPGEPPAFYFAPVLLHEIGHALGLTHTHDAAEVMHARYAPGKVTLTPGDKARARKLYGVPEPSADAARADAPRAVEPAPPAPPAESSGKSGFA